MKLPTLMLTLLMLALPAISSATDESGRIEIVGQGTASSAPELASIGVTVISICYDLSIDAKNANAQLANTVVDIFQKYRRSDRDRITASGGPNVRQTEYLDPTEPGGQRRVLCENKWRATNTITLSTEEMDRIPELQDEILQAIDKVQGTAPSRASQTYAQLGEPAFDVYPETKTKLRSEAQKLAWQDAKAQFDTFASGCSFGSPKLISISQPSFNVRPQFEAMPARAFSAQRTPLLPDKIRVDSQWRFIWSFEPGAGCSRK